MRISAITAMYSTSAKRSRDCRMEYTTCELLEAKRQIDSTIHKLNETLKTLESKENPERYKSQITLAQRRIAAFEIASRLISDEAEKLRSADC